jgi:hypothetical protein
VSAASRGERLGEWSRQLQMDELVNLALNNLSLGAGDAAHEDMRSTMAMTSARITRLASQQAGALND